MDVRQVVTERIIAMLERGGNGYRERWTRAAARGMPRNGKTGAPYRGVNVLLLWDAAMQAGYTSNVWLTYKQAAAVGAQVRRGEKAVLGVHFERRQRRDERELADSEHEDSKAQKGYLVSLPFWVFNVAQIDGLPACVMADVKGLPPGSDRTPIERAMRFIGGCQAHVQHGFDRAAFAPRVDRILMPDVDRFTSPEAYCATALHELVHWTGHPDRLARQFGQRFGDAAYAFEELVAELGAAFLLGHIGLVDATIEGHAAYLDAWLEVLRHDRTAIFTAARLAGEAFEYIVARRITFVEAPAGAVG
ncbi:ArdC family protein [Polaromonas sp.]|uniref:ArdC family protein n=1 Tax=Polaromonas sp. TaxID=1869339 RepID=UPI00352B0469